MIEWKQEKRKVKDLKNWAKNPRKITSEDFDRLKERITKRGFHDVIKINVDNTIISGNQRKRALIDLGVEEVNVLIPDRELTEKEMDEIGLESNRNDGIWDFDILGNEFDMEMLKDIGFSDSELSLSVQAELENPYIAKIEAPIYKPENKKPDILELYNTETYNKLISDIEKSNLSEKEKEFLRISATRHIVFNYQKVADFYANSGKETQELMENSALVIIDFDKAIELGYVKLSKEIDEQFDEEYGE